MGLHLQQLDRPDRLRGRGWREARRQHQAQAQPNNPRSAGMIENFSSNSLTAYFENSAANVRGRPRLCQATMRQ